MKGRILLVEDEAQLAERVAHELGRRGWAVQRATTLAAARALLEQAAPDIVLTDLGLPDGDGMMLVDTATGLTPPAHVVVMSGRDEMDAIIDAMRRGATDYLVKPVGTPQLEAVLDACMAARRTDGDRVGRARPGSMVGQHPLMHELFKTIGSIAGASTPVLIRGESGTGKELIARAIHHASPRAAEPLVAVNCSAVTDTLIASELFGHVRGAFTGALASRKGRFELAGRGTVFLDEIGDTSLAFQAMLLRVLEDHEFYPVGAERARPTHARVIAATHRDLEAAVQRGDFREDLYYRLRVVELRVPALRERASDVPLLVEHVLTKVSGATQRPAPRVTAALLEQLQAYEWPGNVRELENAVMRACAVNRNGVLRWQEFGLGPAASIDDVADPRLDSIIRAHVRTVLDRCGGNQRMTARVLGISRARLERLLSAEATASKRDRPASPRGRAAPPPTP